MVWSQRIARLSFSSSLCNSPSRTRFRGCCIDGSLGILSLCAGGSRRRTINKLSHFQSQSRGSNIVVIRFDLFWNDSRDDRWNSYAHEATAVATCSCKAYHLTVLSTIARRDRKPIKDVSTPPRTRSACGSRSHTRQHVILFIQGGTNCRINRLSNFANFFVRVCLCQHS